MVIWGRVKNGVVVLDNPSALPEGAEVAVSYPIAEGPPSAAGSKRVKFPLVHCKRPGTVVLTGKRVAEILDEEDVSP